jgi:hypothetical protein
MAEEDVVAEEDEAVVEVDAPHAAVSPIAAHISAAATTRPLRVDRSRWNPPGVAVDSGWAVRVSWACSWSFMVALLCEITT